MISEVLISGVQSFTPNEGPRPASEDRSSSTPLRVQGWLGWSARDRGRQGPSKTYQFRLPQPVFQLQAIWKMGPDP